MQTKRGRANAQQNGVEQPSPAAGAQKPKRKKTTPLPQFNMVLSPTRRAQVAETLRSFILSGQIPSGTQLVESKLAANFGVSRGSIREAIWELIDHGLLINRPYSGTFVVTLDEKTMGEVYSTRCALECLCFSQLWPRRDQAFREEFTRRHNALAASIKKHSPLEQIEKEMHFHSYPYEFSGNTVMLDVWHQLAQKIQLSFAMSQVVSRRVDFIDENKRYLDTALGDDLKAMHRIIESHLKLGVDSIQKMMRKQGADTEL